MLPNSSAKAISSILKLKLWPCGRKKLNLCEEDESEDKAAAHPEPAFYGTVVDVVFYGTIDKVFVRLDNSNQTVVAYQYFDDVKRWTPDERVGIWWYERDEVKVQR